MTHSAVHASSSLALPPAPLTGGLVTLVRTRLDAIESRVLPQLRAHRDCLTRIWYSDEPDAIHIHVSDFSAVPCAPTGADRLASAVAAETAMTREASALRDLLAAIETYDAGGAATLAELDAEGQEIGIVARMRLLPRPMAILDRESAEARTYAESTIRRWRQSWDAVFRGLPNGKDTQADELSSDRLRQILSKRINDGLSPSGANRDATAVSACFTWAIEDAGMPLTRPAWRKLQEPDPDAEVSHIEHEELQRVIAAHPPRVVQRLG